MLKKTLVILISLSMLCVKTAFSSPKPVLIDLSDRTPVNAGLRSLILPGWGQFFNDQPLKGYIVAGSAVVTVIGSYLLNEQANGTYNDYLNKGLKNDQLYSDYEMRQQQAMIVSYVAIGVWAYGVADAYIFAMNSSRSTKKKNEGLSIIPTFKKGVGPGVQLCYKKLFN
jgi:hypothetical protein